MLLRQHCGPGLDHESVFRRCCPTTGILDLEALILCLTAVILNQDIFLLLPLFLEVDSSTFRNLTVEEICYDGLLFVLLYLTTPC